MHVDKHFNSKLKLPPLQINLRILPFQYRKEELFYKDEILMKTNIPSIKQASPHMPDLAILESSFNRLKVSAEAGETEKALIIIKNLVNEYEDSSSMKKESLHT